MDITPDDLSSGDVIALLEEHLRDMYATSPPESVHALDIDALKSPAIRFYSGWIDGNLAGCLAIKHLDDQHAELKSMRTAQAYRNQGVAGSLLTHVLAHAKACGYCRVSLETGTQPYFYPAQRLYRRHGFEDCGPFGSYQPDPHSVFMTRRV
ncbi:GNAT family N-acetyltransferase [Alteromonas sp. CYL-A6]|uniref:GNAT family N-acetyltransferase n=1 Tax=Alteromonas nitratireducens TaxID=3390813 RepID=UPI0034A8F5B3